MGRQEADNNMKYYGKHLHVFTDGSGGDECSGWGSTILGMSDVPVDINGVVITRADQPDYVGARIHSNNTAEISGVINALKTIRHWEGHGATRITIHTDSLITLRGATGGRIDSHKQMFAILKDTIDLMEGTYLIEWKHVYGHSGNTWNFRADRLADKAIENHLNGQRNLNPGTIQFSMPTKLQHQDKQNTRPTIQPIRTFAHRPQVEQPIEMHAHRNGLRGKPVRHRFAMGGEHQRQDYMDMDDDIDWALVDDPDLAATPDNDTLEEEPTIILNPDHACLFHDFEVFDLTPHQDPRAMLLRFCELIELKKKLDECNWGV